MVKALTELIISIVLSLTLFYTLYFVGTGIIKFCDEFIEWLLSRKK